MGLYTEIIIRHFYIIKRAQKKIIKTRKVKKFEWKCSFFQQAMIDMAWSIPTCPSFGDFTTFE